MKGATAIAAVLLSSCASTDTNWAIRTPQQAIDIASRDCGDWGRNYPGDWHARIEGDHWYVWKTPMAALYDLINGIDGKPSGCVVVTR